MSVLLFVVGAITLIIGVAAIGFGIPINEFSFGNTLIVAGMTATIGGLIVIALAAVVGQLHRLAETLGEGTATRPGRAGAFEAPLAGPVPAGRMPFPPRVRPEAAVPGPPPFAPVSGPEAAEEPPGLAAEPTLRNPEAPLRNPETPLAPVADEASLSPPPNRPAPPGQLGAADQFDPLLEPTWRPPQPSPEPRPRGTNFDAMWPPRPRQEPSPPQAPAEHSAEPVREAAQAPPAAEPQPLPPEPATEPEDQAPRAVAILKSGVVDGMGYTLYVDGSIEAELPQGTLRFASINDLRSHLERNT